MTPQEQIAKSLEHAFAHRDWKAFYSGLVTLYKQGLADGGLLPEQIQTLPEQVPPEPAAVPEPPRPAPGCARCGDRGECSVSFKNPNRPDGPMVTGIGPCPDCTTKIPVVGKAAPPVVAEPAATPTASPRFVMAGVAVVDTVEKKIVYQADARTGQAAVDQTKIVCDALNGV